MATTRLGHGDAYHSNENLARTTATDEKSTGLAHISSLSKTSSNGVSNEKDVNIEATPAYDVESGESEEPHHVSTAKDLVTNILHVDDDPSLNPWTFRMWFLGELDYMIIHGLRSL